MASQRQIPGGAFVNETGTARWWQAPGAYVNELAAAVGGAPGTHAANGALLAQSATIAGSGLHSTPGSGTVTSQAFKNWSGTLLTGATIPKLIYVRLSDMVTVLTLTNQVTNATTGVIAVTNAALVAGVKYLLITSDATAASYGVEPYTAA